MCCSMDCTGVLDENENYTINGLNEREKGEISLQLFKYIIDFMVKIPCDRTADVAKRRSSMWILLFGEFVLVFEINYLNSSSIYKPHLSTSI